MKLLLKIFSSYLIAAFMLIESSSVVSADQSFNDWLSDFAMKARRQGVSGMTLERALPTIHYSPEVIDHDRRQADPRKRGSIKTYLRRVVSPQRIQRGREFAKKHRLLLRAIGHRYAVQPRFLLAIWGIETHYGKIMGRYHVLSSLATLAHEGRRRSFFEKELMTAFMIIQEGHVQPEMMKGSWAGAMGHPQFMPSSFMNHSVDFDEDGRKDIWSSSPADSLASIAAYLKAAGWQGDRIWGREVILPQAFKKELIGLRIRKSLTTWQSLGVRRVNGRDLPHAPDMKAALIAPDESSRPFFMVYDNFNHIRSYNPSNFYALAVGQLADRLRVR